MFLENQLRFSDALNYEETYKTAWRQVIASIPVIADPILSTRDANHSVFTATSIFVWKLTTEYCRVVAT